MLNIFKNLKENKTNIESASDEEKGIMITTLLVEAAKSDDAFDEQEISKIKKIISSKLHFDEDFTNIIFDKAVEASQDNIELGSLTAAQLTMLRRQHIAMVFQQFGLLPWRTVTENVGLDLEQAGISSDERSSRVAKQLELVGLTDRADARIAELSGGMQQRVGLARAYTTDASILLMDEPFSALDPLIRDHLQAELLDHQKNWAAVLFLLVTTLMRPFDWGTELPLWKGGVLFR